MLVIMKVAELGVKCTTLALSFQKISDSSISKILTLLP